MSSRGCGYISGGGRGSEAQFGQLLHPAVSLAALRSEFPSLLQPPLTLLPSRVSTVAACWVPAVSWVASQWLTVKNCFIATFSFLFFLPSHAHFLLAPVRQHYAHAPSLPQLFKFIGLHRFCGEWLNRFLRCARDRDDIRSEGSCANVVVSLFVCVFRSRDDRAPWVAWRPVRVANGGWE